jgi:hypothetical protein
MSGRLYAGPTLHAASTAQIDPQSARADDCHFMDATLSRGRLTAYGRIIKVR